MVDRGMKMNSKNTTKRTLRAAIVALGGAVALTAMTGCYSPRATDTVTGAALGAGTGALIGSAEGSPGTGALIGGLGGGAVGYIVGTEMYHNGYYGRGGYYPGGF
jgi:osmotically inducible lipoprotein OsmB